MGEATRHFFSGRQASGRPVVSYVIARHEEDDSEVLCVSHASGERTLPVFTDRETVRRFLRSGSLRFGLLGSGWHVRKTSGEELGSLLFGSRAVVCRSWSTPRRRPWSGTTWRPRQRQTRWGCLHGIGGRDAFVEEVGRWSRGNFATYAV